jgi:hypothetical protein
MSPMKKPAQGGSSCNGDFLQKVPEEFSAADDAKYSLWGIAFLLFPLILLGVIAWLVLS